MSQETVAKRGTSIGASTSVEQACPYPVSTKSTLSTLSQLHNMQGLLSRLQLSLQSSGECAKLFPPFGHQ